MTPQTRRRIVVALVAAAALAAAIWAFMPAPIAVDVAAIGRGALDVSVSEEARTRVRDIYTVSAPIGGTLRRAPREVGDQVIAGETVVAVIEPAAPAFLDARARREAEAAVEAAQAMVALAEAQLREASVLLSKARSDFARAEQLRQSGDISASRYDEARAALATAEARVESAEATLAVRQQELQIAEARLVGPHAAGPEGAEETACCLLLRAPIDGEVLSVAQESEQVVAAGTPLLEIGDISKIEIVVEMLSSDAARVRPGFPAVIDGWGGATPLPARVRRVEPAGFTKVSALGIEEQRVIVVLDLEGAPEDRPGLGHGYRVMAHVTLERVQDALLVPLGALFRRGDAWAVYVIDGSGLARERRVEIGARTNREAVVLSGLEAGDRVILHPGDRVTDGTQVTERQAENGG